MCRQLFHVFKQCLKLSKQCINQTLISYRVMPWQLAN